MNETELVSYELGMSFLRPKKESKWVWVGIAVLGLGLAWAVWYLIV